MAGTIVTDRIESDASYASSITVASPMVVSNTINMTGGSFTGNVNINSGTLFLNQNNSEGIPALNLIQDESTIQGPATNTAIRMGGNLVLRAAVQVNIDTGGVGRVVIDSSGRVTKPSQPGFRAGFSTGVTIPSGQTQALPFNSTNYNVGGHYNTSTYRFTAPITGYYLFYTAVGSTSGMSTSTYFGISFTINNTTQNGQWGISSAGYQVQKHTAIYYLNANDYVTVWTEVSTPFDTQNPTFGGYLLG
jgi:hypothetical protein